MSDSLVFISLTQSDDYGDAWFRVDSIHSIEEAEDGTYVRVGGGGSTVTQAPMEILQMMNDAVRQATGTYSDDLDYEEPDE